MFPQINQKNSEFVPFANFVTQATSTCSSKLATYFIETIPELLKKTPAENFKNCVELSPSKKFEKFSPGQTPQFEDRTKMDFAASLTFRVMDNFSHLMQNQSEKIYKNCLDTCNRVFRNDVKSRIACKSACLKTYEEQQTIWN